MTDPPLCPMTGTIRHNGIEVTIAEGSRPDRVSVATEGDGFKPVTMKYTTNQIWHLVGILASLDTDGIAELIGCLSVIAHCAEGGRSPLT